MAGPAGAFALSEKKEGASEKIGRANVCTTYETNSRASQVIVQLFTRFLGQTQ